MARDKTIPEDYRSEAELQGPRPERRALEGERYNRSKRSRGAVSELPKRGRPGRGPSDHERPDVRIWETVCERLSEDPDIDASDIRVEVDDGVVILSGKVESRVTKYHIERLVEHVPGVRSVENRLKMRRGDPLSHQIRGAEQAVLEARARARQRPKRF